MADNTVTTTTTQEKIMQGMQKNGLERLKDTEPQVTTPDYMIKIGALTKSGVKALQKFSQLDSYQEMIGHTVSHHVAGTLFSSGSVTASHVTIWLPSGSWLSNVLNAMNAGQEIKDIVIKKLANIQKNNVTTMEILYSGCHIIEYKPDGNRAILTFRFVKRKQTYTEYGQDGKKKGKTSTLFDFLKNSSK